MRRLHGNERRGACALGEGDSRVPEKECEEQRKEEETAETADEDDGENGGIRRGVGFQC